MEVLNPNGKVLSLIIKGTNWREDSLIVLALIEVTNYLSLEEQGSLSIKLKEEKLWMIYSCSKLLLVELVIWQKCKMSLSRNIVLHQDRSNLDSSPLKTNFPINLKFTYLILKCCFKRLKRSSHQIKEWDTAAHN